MPYKTPTSFSAARRIKLSGVVYGSGDPIPNDVIKAMRKADVLISNGWIIPDADPYSRRGKQGHKPFHISADSRQKLDVTPPAMATNLFAFLATNSQIGFEWTNPGDVAKVIVRRAVGNVAPATTRSGTSVPLEGDTDSAVVVEGLDADTQYSFSVFVKDAAGNTSEPATLTENTEPNPPPEEPGG